MAIQNRRLNRLLFRILPFLAAVAVILTSLVLVSNVEQEANGFGRHYIWVLVLTGLALVLLFAAIVHRGFSLVRRVRNEEPGSRLSARWVRNFIALSLPPALIVYFFSAYFLTRTVDSWFDVQVEAALADSLALGQEILDNRTLEVRNLMRRLGREVTNLTDDPEILRRSLLSSVSAAGPVELSVLETDGRVVATANIDALADLPDRPGDYALLQALERGEYAAAEPVPDGGLRIRVIQQLPDSSPGRPEYLLQALYPLPPRIVTLAGSIEQEYHRYQNVSYLRNSLKQSFILILSLVLLLTVLLAILAALAASRRMVSPISRLADATHKVAGGDLAHAVEIDTRDELEFLARSFNDMTRALLRSNQEAESGRARLQAQGEYLETVLGSLSAGVLTLDADGRVVRANPAAQQILRLPGDYPVGRQLDSLTHMAPFLEPFASTVHKQIRRGRKDWQREIRLQPAGAPLVLLVRGSRLAGVDSDAGGHVVVFDDVTILNQAQRDAAWAEVARRLAHEVKNPLTPIRLAAERLRMKLMDKLEPADGQMLDRAASTIVSQVEALRTLVDAFRDYASEPELNRSELRLDKLVEDVVALYQEGDPSLRIRLDLCPGPAGLSADGGQIRQLLHNLIRNAAEARESGRHAEIAIASRLTEQDGRNWLRLDIRDRGPGFPETVLEKPFEPYVTNKENGSGLGLAICRKIVNDHDGTIAISNPEDGGALATVMLPLVAALDSGEARSATAAG
jgi:nitrogen fixation/metabolism regulation signal transduction histidine kinase